MDAHKMFRYKHAKGQYGRKVESYDTGYDTRCIWQGLQTIPDYKGKPSHELPSNKELPNELNAFYALFEEYSTLPCVIASVFPDYSVVSLSVADVSKVFNLLWLQSRYRDRYDNYK